MKGGREVVGGKWDSEGMERRERGGRGEVGGK